MRTLIVSEGKHESEGALQSLVRRLAEPKGLECEQQPLKLNEIRAYHGKGQGFFKKAIRWLLHAQDLHYEGVVLVVDEDGDADRVRQINKAQESTLATIRRALGVAIRMFDAWMLADEMALSKAVGTTVQRQPDPESVKDPKAHCQQLRDESGTRISLSSMYASVAQSADIDVLKQRCRRGFAPFASRVERL